MFLRGYPNHVLTSLFFLLHFICNLGNNNFLIVKKKQFMVLGIIVNFGILVHFLYINAYFLFNYFMTFMFTT